MAISNFAKKRVLVTGAASGIGLATARAFAAVGCRVALADVAEETVKKAGAEIAALGGDCITIACDLSAAAAVERLTSEIDAAFGGLDILVNNAGIGFLGDFLHTPDDAWERIFAINLMAMVRITRAFLPGMLAHGGEAAVVNVASALGFTAGPCLSAYSATKHAVVGFSEALGMELVDTNVSVSIIAPGIIDTAIVKSPGAVADNITDAQLAQIQIYYREKGCAPDLVAQAILQATRHGRRIVPIGPKARAMAWLPRLSRRLMRRASISGGRTIGYVN